MLISFNNSVVTLLMACLSISAFAQKKSVRIIPVANGWAKNSVNAVVFRKNSLVTFGDTQYIAFYDSAQNVVLGKRMLSSLKWELSTTQYKGDANDAHRSISIMVDGDGYLHITWDHHANALNYARGKMPGSLVLSAKMPMTGKKETKVTYPEFYKLPNGDLLFLYRDGSSGNGNLMLNRYNLKDKKWVQIKDGLIDGEGKRNAYWQMATDSKGTIHLSWVWRESPDVASNHDMCYARSTDGGISWEKSTGEKYSLPITVTSAEIAWPVPQKSELINQTSMSISTDGNPYIATYWKGEGSTVPQYRIIYHDGKKWNMEQVSNRAAAFSLSGAGTKQIPIARPQIMVSGKTGKENIAMLFRDVERGDKASIASTSKFKKGKWQFQDLTAGSLGAWEPSYDTELWKQKKLLNVFVEKVEQGDAEGIKETKPQPVYVLGWKPKK